MKHIMAKGDIVLITFPFSDLSSSKLRPAAVLAETDEDLTVCFITAQMGRQNLFQDTLTLSSCSFASTPAKKTSPRSLPLSINQCGRISKSPSLPPLKMEAIDPLLRGLQRPLAALSLAAFY